MVIRVGVAYAAFAVHVDPAPLTMVDTATDSTARD
jgi:hypothetical protein